MSFNAMVGGLVALDFMEVAATSCWSPNIIVFCSFLLVPIATDSTTPRPWYEEREVVETSLLILFSSSDTDAEETELSLSAIM